MSLIEEALRAAQDPLLAPKEPARAPSAAAETAPAAPAPAAPQPIQARVTPAASAPSAIFLPLSLAATVLLGSFISWNVGRRWLDSHEAIFPRSPKTSPHSPPALGPRVASPWSPAGRTSDAREAASQVSQRPEAVARVEDSPAEAGVGPPAPPGPHRSTARTTSADRREDSPLILSGVVEGLGTPYAVINGMVRGIGETIEGSTLIAIANGAVRVRRADGAEVVLHVAQ